MTYFWDFGDGHTSTAQNPSHIYANPGTYVITVTIDGIFTFSKTVFISILEPVTIGAYEFVDGTHVGDYFVKSSGNDYRNRGGFGDPFRTLDKAMLVADSTIQIDGGHYDLYYLNLRSESVDLNNPIFIYPPSIDSLILYITLQQADVEGGYVRLPVQINVEDTENVALNVIGGFTQGYGTDFIIDQDDYFGNPYIRWAERDDNISYGLDGLLEAGDILRIQFKEGLQRKLSNLLLHGHYSNIEIEKAVYVSPNGSDSSVMGGDGTNTGGDGSLFRPYRTITRALNASAPGSYLVAMAGEYPIFNGKDDLSLAIGIDRTAVSEIVPRQFMEDLFDPMDFGAFGTTFPTSPISWDFSSSGSSSASIGGGFLNFTYDGTHTASAVSTFQIQNDFEITAVLRNAVDPLKFMVTSPDNTAVFICDSTRYYAGVTTGGVDSLNYGVLDSSYVTDRYVTEYHSVSGNDLRNKYAPLKYVPEDCSNIAVSIVGGTSQNLGEDFYVNDSKIKWNGMALDGEIQAGDVVRSIYLDRSISLPLKFSIKLENSRFTLKYFDDGWKVANLKNMVGSYSGPWSLSFLMDTNGSNDPNCVYGRGYASELAIIAKSFYNTDLDKKYTFNTERKTVALFQDVPLAITTDSTLMTGSAGSLYYAHIDASGGSSDFGYPSLWSWSLAGTPPTGLTFTDRVTYAFMDGTTTTAGDYTFSVTLTDPGSREGSVTKQFYAKVI